MIKEIFQERIPEQRQTELEEAERARKKAEELATVLKKAETDISSLLKNAPVSAFKIPDEAIPAIVIVKPENESKGEFEKKYDVYTGYIQNSHCQSQIGDIEFVMLEPIGAITLTFLSPTNSVDFSGLFKEEGKLIEKSNNLFVIFENYEA